MGHSLRVVDVRGFFSALGSPPPRVAGNRFLPQAGRRARAAAHAALAQAGDGGRARLHAHLLEDAPRHLERADQYLELSEMREVDAEELDEANS